MSNETRTVGPTVAPIKRASGFRVDDAAGSVISSEWGGETESFESMTSAPPFATLELVHGGAAAAVRSSKSSQNDDASIALQPARASGGAPSDGATIASPSAAPSGGCSIPASAPTS